MFKPAAEQKLSPLAVEGAGGDHLDPGVHPRGENHAVNSVGCIVVLCNSEKVIRDRRQTRAPDRRSYQVRPTLGRIRLRRDPVRAV